VIGLTVSAHIVVIAFGLVAVDTFVLNELLGGNVVLVVDVVEVLVVVDVLVVVEVLVVVDVIAQAAIQVEYPKVPNVTADAAVVGVIALYVNPFATTGLCHSNGFGLNGTSNLTTIFVALKVQLVQSYLLAK
jgi:hypothetical protein